MFALSSSTGQLLLKTIQTLPTIIKSISTYHAKGSMNMLIRNTDNLAIEKACLLCHFSLSWLKCQFLEFFVCLWMPLLPRSTSDLSLIWLSRAQIFFSPLQLPMMMERYFSVWFTFSSQVDRDLSSPRRQFHCHQSFTIFFHIHLPLFMSLENNCNSKDVHH